MIAQLFRFDLSVLGWAVLHLAWQGLLVGAMAELALRWLRHSEPRRREAVAGGALALLVLLFAVNAARMAMVALEIGPAGLASPGVLPPRALDALAPWVGGAWLLGATWLLVRFGLAVAATRRLRAQARPADAPAQARLDTVAARMHITAPIALLVSDQVDVPCLVGCLGPAIVLPAGAVADEGVLAHELAHLERHDPWRRSAGLIARALLVFHPVAHRLVARLDIERELACDDRAAEVTGSAARYARALAELERARPGRLSSGTAADGAPLVDRVRRLVAPGPQLPERSARTRAWTSALAIGLVAFAVTQTPHPAGPTLPMTIARALGPPAQHGILDGAEDHTRIQVKDVHRTHHHD